jgi:hypothetical protein
MQLKGSGRLPDEAVSQRVSQRDHPFDAAVASEQVMRLVGRATRADEPENRGTCQLARL